VSPNPFDDSESYDVIVVGGRSSPGVVKLSGHDRAISWDVKEGSGQNGASTTKKGEKPIEFTATFSLVLDVTADQNQFDAWAEFKEILESTVSGTTPKALDIDHPDLAANGIKSVVLSSMGGMVHDGKGGATVAVKLLQYRAPKPTGGSASGSKSKAKSGNAAPDPDAEAKAELARLTQQYKETPWQ
jgi:hypothetical protein